MERYTIKDFQRDFPNDEACLEWLKNYRWPDGIPCVNCNSVTKHHLMNTRRSYSCQECGNHVHPTAGTIYHKSTTPLTTWFYTIYLMAQTRGGISAKQIERETGVTYKTSWRMCRLIRQQLDGGHDLFSGPVEVDETYMGGKAKNMHKSVRRRKIKGRGVAGKTPVVGVVERAGKIKTITVPNVRKDTLQPVVESSVKPRATIYTDENESYGGLTKAGFNHARVVHSHDVYVLGDAHTNTIDGFWGIVKPGIRGVYPHVSPKYLPHYMNEYAFRYNHRKDITPMFLSFLGRAGLPLGG